MVEEDDDGDETVKVRRIRFNPPRGNSNDGMILMKFPDDSQEIRNVVCARYVPGNPLFWFTS